MKATTPTTKSSATHDTPNGEPPLGRARALTGVASTRANTASMAASMPAA
jgi:hypothetical protein